MYVFIFGSFFTAVFLLCLACALGLVSQQPDRCDRHKPLPNGAVWSDTWLDIPPVSFV